MTDFIFLRRPLFGWVRATLGSHFGCQPREAFRHSVREYTSFRSILRRDNNKLWQQYGSGKTNRIHCHVPQTSRPRQNYFYWTTTGVGLTASYTSASDTDADRLNRRLEKQSLVEVPVIGDGACQFRALAGAMWGDESRHFEVRKAVVLWLAKNENFAIDDDGTTVSAFLDTATFRDWRTYLQYMSKSSAWGDQLTLFAAAQVYKRSICIISSVAAEKDEHATQLIAPTNGEATDEPVLTLSLYHEMHYNYCEKVKDVTMNNATKSNTINKVPPASNSHETTN